MHGVTRRSVLAAGAVAGAAGTAGAQERAPPFVRSDIGTLRRVLVHSITPADGTLLDRWDDRLIPYADTDLTAAVRQQAALINLLRGAGAEIVEVAEALETAIAETRPSGVFGAWLEAAFPRLAADPSQATVARLLGRDPAAQYNLGPGGDYRHRADDTSPTTFTRDSAFMTPQGLVICNSSSRIRRRENMLMRFLYAHSPLLDKYPIAFDAVEEGLIIEGGDAQVADERTLLLGVGNRTDPRIAPVLARRLNMDVVAVQTLKRDFLRPRLPGEPVPIIDLRILFLHLDTYFTHVGPRHALIAPHMFEKDKARSNPLARYIRGARAETIMSIDDADAALEMLAELGRVRFYRRGTGREEALGDVKLEDYLRGRGYRFTHVGGRPPAGEAEQFRHFMQVAYHEFRKQGANVVQAAPGRVIAYDSAPATRAALETDGIQVDAFEGRELWAWDGGPHCLTQPLERA